MKTLKSKLFMLTLSLIGVVAMSFALVNEEKPEAKTETKASIAWRYVGTDNPGVFSHAANWTQGEGSGCGPTGDTPCQLTADASNQTELAAYLAGRDNNNVLAISDSRRD